MKEFSEGGEPRRNSQLVNVLAERYELKPEISSQESDDRRTMLEVLQQTKGKVYFVGDSLDTPVRPFGTVLDQVNMLPAVRDRQNKLSIEYPGLDFASHPTKLVAQAYILHEGKPGKPVIMQVPGYGSKPSKVNLLLLGQFTDFTHVGLEVFHGITDAVKVADHIENLQAAFVLSTRMLREYIQISHKAGLQVFVVGSSFGGKTISSHLNELARNGHVDSQEIADGYVPVQGGLLAATFTGEYYRNKMMHPEIAQHEALQEGYAFPAQLPLPPELSKTVGSVVNTTDNVALGQEVCWRGTNMYKVRGTHFSGVALNLLGIRKYLHDFISERVQ